MAAPESDHVNPLAVSFLYQLDSLHRLVGEARQRIAGANGTLTTKLVEEVIAQVRDGEFGVRVTGMATRTSLVNAEKTVSSAVEVQDELDQMVKDAIVPLET